MQNTSGFPYKKRKRSSGEKRTAGGGARNLWAKRLNGAEYARLQFELRKHRKKARKIADAGEEVTIAAKVVLEKTYGGPLPVQYEQPVDIQAPDKGIAPNVLTSKDQRELMSDMDLIGKAIKEQWPVESDVKLLAVLRLKSILAKQSGVKDELYLKAVETLVKVDRANSNWLQMANPQKHEHVHVEIESPPVEQRRAALLDLIRRNGLPGTVGPARRIDGPDDGEQCIDVGEQPA